MYKAILTIPVCFSLAQEKAAKPDPYPETTPKQLYDEMFARKKPNEFFYAPGLKNCRMKIAFNGEIKPLDPKLESYMVGMERGGGVKTGKELQKIYTHTAKFGGPSLFMFVIQPRFIPGLEQLAVGEEVEVFISFMGTYSGCYVFMVNGIKIPPRQPNQSLHSDGAASGPAGKLQR